MPESTVATLSAFVREHRNPHWLYDAQRRREPIGFDASSKYWIVTGHVAAKKILGDSRFGSDVTAGSAMSDPASPAGFAHAAVKRQIIFADGEHHQAVRHVILRESAEKTHQLLPELRALAAGLLRRARQGSEFDLVKDFALPYSLAAISRVLGMPLVSLDEMAQLARWSASFANVTSGFLRVHLEEIVRLGDYFRGLVGAT